MRLVACVVALGLAQPRLPGAPGPFGPSQARLSTGAHPAQKLADIDTCESCHAGVAAQYRTSAHGFASFNNPIYRLTIDRLRTALGTKPSRFCAGCHDVSLLLDGAMDREVRADDARAHAGITCRTCHSIKEARADGNGSYTLDPSPIPLPREGDPASLRRHQERVRPLRTAALCGACHRALLGEDTGNAHHLAGADDLGPWARSAYAGSGYERLDDPLPAKDCRGCHMPLEAEREPDPAAKGGKLHSHRFLGGHTWLAAMRNDPAQAARAQAFLRDVASIDVAAAIAADGTRTLPADGAPVVPGQRLRLDVVVKNLSVGHRFPGGTLDAQDTWIEVVVDDATGRRVAEAGTHHHDGGEDPGAHRLVALIADGDGQVQRARETHRFAAVIANHTLAPRDAAVIEYTLDVPTKVALPLRVRARLRHRSRGLPLQRAACEDGKGERGRAFAAAARSLGQPVLDACTPQPVVEIAETESWLGGRRAAASRPSWRRLLDHARGLLHAVQERREEARPSLLLALAEVERGGTPLEHAMVLSVLGELDADQGRPSEALAWIDRAERLVGTHPALARIRGAAYEAVWRWKEAVPWLRAAASAAPRATDAWVRLAIALGSAGDQDRAALEAARQGLALNPRQPDLLRVQALALANLRAPGEEAARAASLLHRLPDAAQRILLACAQSVPGCALERAPVHAHELKLVAPP